MKRPLIASMISIALLAIVGPIFILQYYFGLFENNFDSYKANEIEDYYCMLDVTTLTAKLEIDIELSKRRFQWLSQVTTSPQTVNQAQFFPQDCVASETIAVIIPFRDRDEHLRILLGHLHPILQKQLVRFTEMDNDRCFELSNSHQQSYPFYKLPILCVTTVNSNAKQRTFYVVKNDSWDVNNKTPLCAWLFYHDSIRNKPY